MEVPILKQGTVLIATFQAALSDADLNQLRMGLVQQVVKFRSRAVIVGIQPEVAFAMVQLGLTLEDVTTALDLEEGLAYLNEKFKNTH